jgi:drug/metabolite transporter (DMT)-like permease
LISFALVAFAANSIFCRLALETQTIDPAGFTGLRLGSGAVVLWLCRAFGPHRRAAPPKGSWASGLALFLYAALFSFAYVSLAAGTGALILFGAVQATMILAGVRLGERPGRLEWAGLATALAGLVYLVSPGLQAPSPVGALLMAGAGIAWGVYSLRGRHASDAVAANAANFLRAVPPALALGLIMAPRLEFTAEGVFWALISGALTSGLGYVVWYAGMRRLTAARGAFVQLPVPLLAALGGVLFLSEPITLRLVLAAVLIVGGVGLCLSGRMR